MRRLGTLGVLAIPYLLLIFVAPIVTATTRSEVTVLLDPTIRFWIVAAILGLPFAAGFNLFERSLSKLAPAPEEWWRTLMLSWIVILVTLGIVNAAVAFTADISTYVNVKLFGLTALFWLSGLVLIYMHFKKDRY